MRLFLLHALMIAAALGSISSAAAEGRYCLQGGTWGYPGNCQFSTYHQCKMSASGTISIAASTLDMLIIAIHRANQAVMHRWRTTNDLQEDTSTRDGVPGSAFIQCGWR